MFFGGEIVDGNLITEIRRSVDIVEVVSKYVPLSPHGKNYFGVCPFHDDHSPSMSVSKEKQIYTCFSCGATGNVFTFLQEYENIGFMEAVKICADIAGIEMNYHKTKEYNKYQSLYNIYDIAQKFYQNNINSSKGLEAKEYLHNRKLSDEIIKEFQIGLSLNKNDALTKMLTSKYDVKDLLTSGLVNESGTDLYDVYRNRIMFPLYDLTGKIIGYNGRIYEKGDTSSKYINPKETPIFKKRELLYNYHRAKDIARVKKQIIVLEGPMDVIRSYSAGVKNVVAALGTAFGKEQAMLVRKLSTNVILCFDGDQAGLKATKGAIDELSKLGITPKIVRLPDNLDPDEFILKNGADSFKSYLDHAMNLMEFNEQILKDKVDFNNSEDVAKYTNDMLKEISKIDDDVLKELSLNKLSEETHLEKEFLLNKLSDKPKNNLVSTKKSFKRLSKYEKSEQRLLFYMLKDKKVIKMYDKKITHIQTDRYRHLAFQISYFHKCHGYIDIADLMVELHDDPESIKTIGEITSLKLKEDYTVDEIDDYLNNIREYNERNKTSRYKQDLSQEYDFKKKIELAKQVVAYKIRSEEND